MNCTLTSEELKEYLIKLDMKMQLWAIHCIYVEEDIGGFDGDAWYTPIERIMIHLAERCGFDYHKDIGDEATRRLKEEEF